MAKSIHAPILKEDERIEDWKPLFQAATAGLRATKGGVLKALQMLPNYVNRTYAERRLVVEVIEENKEAASLDVAFATLIKQIVPPKDPHRGLRELRKTDWQAGESVDDFFYRMQDLAREARPSTSMACNIFVSQFPLSIQPSLREWLDVREEVGTKEARELIVKVKTALVEKNIPLDYGYRELGKIAVLQREEAPKVRVEPAPEREIPQDESKCPAVYITTSGRPGGASRGQGYGQGRSRPFERRTSGRYQQRGRCFICGSNQHFMSQCPERYCPKCGEKGHETRNCPNTKGYRGVFQTVSRQEGIKDTAVVVPMNQPIDVMIDTGANPSVVDKRTIQAMHIPYETKEDRVYGLGRTPLVVCGVARVYIDIGDSHLVDHEIEVLDTDAKTAILGRRFLSLYKDTTFDWENWRVNLGEHWVPSLAAVYGGQAVTRAEVIRIEAEGVRSTIATGFDINQQLSSRQRQAIYRVLDKWRGVFAENPKKPQEIRNG